MKAWILATALLAVSSTAWGEDRLKGVSAVNPSADKGEGPTWPLPWAESRMLVYDTGYQSIEQRDGVEVGITGSSMTTVDAAVRDAGFVQRWRSDDIVFEIKGMPPTPGLDMQAIMTTAGKAFDGVVLDVELDAAGAYVGISNIGEMSKIMQRVMRKMFDDMSSGVRKAQPDADLDAQWDAFVDNIVRQISAPAVIESALAEIPMAYNFMAGGGLALDTDYAFSDEGVLPVGDVAVRRDNSVRVRESETPGKYDVRWDVALDRDAVRESVLIAFDEMMASFPEMQGMGAQVFADGIDVGSVVEYRIDGGTGVVEWMRITNRKNFAGRKEVDTNTLVLAEPVHH